MSLTNQRNKKGPKMDSWGTPTEFELSENFLMYADWSTGRKS